MPQVKSIMNLRGEQGGRFINDTTAYTSQTWSCLQVIEDAVIASLTMPKFDDSDDVVAVTLPQGFILYGWISALTLTSGTVQMFNYADPAHAAASV